MNAPSPRLKRAALALTLGIVVLALPVWLPIFGTALAVDEAIQPADVALAVDEAIQPADVALVLEGTAKDATDTAELWRAQGIVRDVVIVEAPVKTHGLVAYWSDFVRWGLTAPPQTPAEHLRVVRAASTQTAQQAHAALAAVQATAARHVLVPGGGGVGSRLVERELRSVLDPAGIDVRLVRYRDDGRPPAQWYLNAEDRRAVLDSWLQLLVPFLSGYEPGDGTYTT